jgi:hypothetical protein
MPTTEDQMRMHLVLGHGVYVGDVKEHRGLIECHDVSHSDPDPRQVIPHTHHDVPPTPEREWNWE